MTDVRGRHRRRTVLRCALVAVLVAGAAWAVGVDAGHVVALGLAAGAVVGVLAVVPLPVAAPWPPEEPETSGTGWHQVALLASDLATTDRDPDRIGPTLDRLRSLAAARLDHGGLRWADPRAREVLGPDLYDVLDGRAAPRAVSPLLARTLDALDALDALEALDALHPPDARDDHREVHRPDAP